MIFKFNRDDIKNVLAIRNKFTVPFFIIWLIFFSVYLAFLDVLPNHFQFFDSMIVFSFCALNGLLYPIWILLIKTSFLKKALISFSTGLFVLLINALADPFRPEPGGDISEMQLLLLLFLFYSGVVSLILLVVGLIISAIQYLKARLSGKVFTDDKLLSDC